LGPGETFTGKGTIARRTVRGIKPRHSANLRLCIDAVLKRQKYFIKLISVFDCNASDNDVPMSFQDVADVNIMIVLAES
jgi:hypothetical protein